MNTDITVFFTLPAPYYQAGMTHGRQGASIEDTLCFLLILLESAVTQTVPCVEVVTNICRVFPCCVFLYLHLAGPCAATQIQNARVYIQYVCVCIYIYIQYTESD